MRDGNLGVERNVNRAWLSTLGQSVPAGPRVCDGRGTIFLNSETHLAPRSSHGELRTQSELSSLGTPLFFLLSSLSFHWLEEASPYTFLVFPFL